MWLLIHIRSAQPHINTSRDTTRLSSGWISQSAQSGDRLFYVSTGGFDQVQQFQWGTKIDLGLPIRIDGFQIVHSVLDVVGLAGGLACVLHQGQYCRFGFGNRLAVAWFYLLQIRETLPNRMCFLALGTCNFLERLGVSRGYRLARR